MLWTLVGLALCVSFYFLLVKPFTRWKNVGVAQYGLLEAWKELVAGIYPVRPFPETLKKAYFAFPGERYSGWYQFGTPALVLRDPELIKQITIKDFDHFTDHFQFVPDGIDPMWNKNLFALRGDKWKEMRPTLSPSFTSSKMKMMFEIISECSKQFVRYFQEQGSGTRTIDTKDAFTRFTNDVIASAAFGLSCDSLRDRDNQFYHMGKAITDITGPGTLLKFFVMCVSPTLSKTLGITLFGKEPVRFFQQVIKDTLEARRKNNLVRLDMIHLLLEAQKEKENADRPLTDEDIMAQGMIFFFAGFDSASTLMCFMAHELAVHPDIQERLQQEVDDLVRECKGNVSYEALMKMKYMDMVISGSLPKMSEGFTFLHLIMMPYATALGTGCSLMVAAATELMPDDCNGIEGAPDISKTLRLWPGGMATDRVCIKPYTIEGEPPVHMKEGDVVWIPFFGLHHDPQYFPNPNKFDPERFSEERKNEIVPYSYIPFGVGPRSCIGNRFALMETKLVFFHILKEFELVVVEKTCVPLKLTKTPFKMMPEGGFWLGLKPRQK